MAEYDLILKSLAEHYPEHFVAIVRGPGIEIEKVERLEKEAVATHRTSDILLKVVEDGYEYILLIEIQTRPDRDMPLKLLEYTAMQHRAYKKPVYPVVINLTGKGYAEEHYTYDCLDITVLNFYYRQFNLDEINGRNFLYRGPIGLLPLVPLMRHDEPPEKILEACATRVEREVESETDRAGLFLGLAVISSLRLSKEIILRLIEVSKMENSPLFDGIREEWVSRGEVKGRVEGRVEGRVDSIMDALEENTGKRPDKFFEARLHSIKDDDKLKKLFRVAIKTKNLEQFVIALQEIEQAGRIHE